MVPHSLNYKLCNVLKTVHSYHWQITAFPPTTYPCLPPHPVLISSTSSKHWWFLPSLSFWNYIRVEHFFLQPDNPGSENTVTIQWQTREGRTGGAGLFSLDGLLHDLTAPRPPSCFCSLLSSFISDGCMSGHWNLTFQRFLLENTLSAGQNWLSTWLNCFNSRPHW